MGCLSGSKRFSGDSVSILFYIQVVEIHVPCTLHVVTVQDRHTYYSSYSQRKFAPKCISIHVTVYYHSNTTCAKHFYHFGYFLYILFAIMYTSEIKTAEVIRPGKVFWKCVSHTNILTYLQFRFGCPAKRADIARN